MASIALMLFMAVAAADGSSWLQVRADAGCPAGRLAEQIAERIVGERNAALRLEVALKSGAAATVATLGVWRGAEALGTKTLLAPSCDEALAAIAAVAALAVSHRPAAPRHATERVAESSPPAPARAATSPAPTPTAAVHRSPPSPTTTAPHRSVALERDTSAGDSERDRLGVSLVGAAGADVGTLAEPAPVIGLGAWLGTAWGELRAVAWYGLPTTREEISQVTERTTADFLALSLDHCRGLDEQRWFRLCGGLETTLRRTSRLQQEPGEPSRDEAHLEPSFGPLLGAAFAYRAARWAPELDVSMRLPLLEARGPMKLAVRAAIGAAVPF